MKNLSILFASLLVTACVSIPSKHTSHFHSVIYDKKTDFTEYRRLPGGTIKIPHEWKEAGYMSSSGEMELTNTSGELITIAFNDVVKYSFYSNELKGIALLDAFYKWESEYILKETWLKISVLERGADYILYHIYGNNDLNNMFLASNKNDRYLYIYAIKTSPMGDEQRAAFLKDIHKNNL